MTLFPPAKIAWKIGKKYISQKQGTVGRQANSEGEDERGTCWYVVFEGGKNVYVHACICVGVCMLLARVKKMV